MDLEGSGRSSPPRVTDSLEFKIIKVPSGCVRQCQQNAMVILGHVDPVRIADCSSAQAQPCPSKNLMQPHPGIPFVYRQEEFLALVGVQSIRRDRQTGFKYHLHKSLGDLCHRMEKSLSSNNLCGQRCPSPRSLTGEEKVPESAPTRVGEERQRRKRPRFRRLPKARRES